MSEHEDPWDSALAQLAARGELHGAWLNGLAYNPAASGPVLQRILTANERLDYSGFWLEIRELTAEAGAVLVRHPDRKVRFQLTQNPSLSLDALAVLGKDPDRVVKMLALESIQRRDPELHRVLAPESHGPNATGDAAPSSLPARTPLTETEALALVTSPDRLVRAHAAWDERVPQDVALTLADDPEPQVRLYLSMREDLSEDQRSAIAYVVPHGYHQVPGWLTGLMKNPQAIAEYARSSHVLIRRSVAMAKHLPPEAVALLAQDEDFFVKLTLADRCLDAPHELIIEMFSCWHGLRWSALRYRPNFVRNGMAADFAVHSNARLRWAALDDPEASPELVEALSHDPSGTVYPWAISDPRLPTARLQEALGDGRTALSAARNSRLPDTVMHQLLDYAGVGPCPPDPDDRSGAA
jgi:hypothetical protein